jgi:hypothetical protein
LTDKAVAAVASNVADAVDETDEVANKEANETDYANEVNMNH